MGEKYIWTVRVCKPLYWPTKIIVSFLVLGTDGCLIITILTTDLLLLSSTVYLLNHFHLCYGHHWVHVGFRLQQHWVQHDGSSEMKQKTVDKHSYQVKIHKGKEMADNKLCKGHIT